MLFRSVSQGTRISVPGCHASGFVSLIYPLVQSGLLPKSAHVSCTSLTGYSGGGKSMIEQYEKSEGLQAPRHYALGQTHKHLPEMTTATGLENTPHFMPIVGSFYSGMCVSIPLHASQLAPRTTLADVQNCLQTHYKKAWMVSVVTAEQQGVIQDGFLPADALHGSDNMRLLVCGNDERMTLYAQYDNLGKGASAAAVQCMNLMLGLPDGIGL